MMPALAHEMARLNHDLVLGDAQDHEVRIILRRGRGVDPEDLDEDVAAVMEL